MMMMMMVRLGRVQCLLPGRGQLRDGVRFDVDHVAMIVTRDQIPTSLLIDLDHVVVVVAKDETGLLRRLVLIPGPVILPQAVSSRGEVRMGRRVAMRFRRFHEFRVPRRRISIVSANRTKTHRERFSKDFFFSRE